MALVTHALVAAMSGIFWFHSKRLREGALAGFGDALPAPTQILYDFQIPSLVFGLLVTALRSWLSAGGRCVCLCAGEAARFRLMASRLEDA